MATDEPAGFAGGGRPGEKGTGVGCYDFPGGLFTCGPAQIGIGCLAKRGGIGPVALPVGAEAGLPETARVSSGMRGLPIGGVETGNGDRMVAVSEGNVETVVGEGVSGGLLVGGGAGEVQRDLLPLGYVGVGGL